MSASKLIELAKIRAFNLGRILFVFPSAQTCRIRSVVPLDCSEGWVVHPDGLVEML